MRDIFSSLEENANGIFRTGVLFVILTALAIGARIVFKRSIQIKIGIEDYFHFAAAICFWVLEAFNFKGEFFFLHEPFIPISSDFWQ